MTATDELRRMLDERGIEYSMHEDSWARETYWIVGHNPYRFSERSEYGTCVLHNLTPAQAIAATLGREAWSDFDMQMAYHMGYEDALARRKPDAGKVVTNG